METTRKTFSTGHAIRPAVESVAPQQEAAGSAGPGVRDGSPAGARWTRPDGGVRHAGGRAPLAPGAVPPRAAARPRAALLFATNAAAGGARPRPPSAPRVVSG